MKNLYRDDAFSFFVFLSMIFFSSGIRSIAQAPGKINYQGIAWDASGNPLTAATVSAMLTGVMPVDPPLIGPNTSNIFPVKMRNITAAATDDPPANWSYIVIKPR